jgi:hypothetical protein
MAPQMWNAAPAEPVATNQSEITPTAHRFFESSSDRRNSSDITSISREERQELFRVMSNEELTEAAEIERQIKTPGRASRGIA